MYVDHFNLKKRPFAFSPDSEAFMSTAETEKAVERIKQLLLARDGAAVITGGPGVGKSSIVAQATKPLKDRVIVANLDLRQTDPTLLYDMLLLSMGADIGNGNMADSLHRLQAAIAKANHKGRTVTAVIDLNGFTVERANHILRLVHMAGESGGQLNIILLGPHVLHRFLDTPGLIHLRQRISYRFRVRPLTVNETDEYIQHQLRIAAVKFKDILSNGVAMTVYHYVGGVPRLINTLMDAVLSEACAKGLEVVNAELVREVAKGLGWKPLSRVKTTEAPGLSNPQPQAAAAPAKQATRESTQTVRESPVAGQTETRGTTEAPAAKPAGPAESENPDHLRTTLIFEQPTDFSPGAGAAEDESVADTINEPGATTQRLLAAADKLETELQEDATGKHRSVAQDEPGANSVGTAIPGIPAMNPDDTGATGMLRLEDLDARFAETVFGDDTGMFNALDKLAKLRAGENVDAPTSADDSDDRKSAQNR
jgi:general secretion pathway protein A